MKVRDLGPVIQLAFVPADMAAALRFWTETMGVGPFFLLRHVKPLGLVYKGRPTDFDFSVALAYWGDMQIELIEQHDDVPSIYSDWRRAGRDGVHHICLTVDDLEEARRVCGAAGGEIVQEILLEDSGAIYVDVGDGPIVEVLKRSAGFDALFAMIREAATAWDGSDPIREVALG